MPRMPRMDVDPQSQGRERIGSDGRRKDPAGGLLLLHKLRRSFDQYNRLPHVPNLPLPFAITPPLSSYRLRMPSLLLCPRAPASAEPGVPRFTVFKTSPAVQVMAWTPPSRFHSFIPALRVRLR
jgi:hypothetical protein